MSKKMLRFCVLIYKGIVFITTVFIKIIGLFFKLFDSEKRKKDLYNKTNNIIKQEKIKQKKIIDRENRLLEKEKKREEKINARKMAIESKREKRLNELSEKKRLRLEKKVEKKRQLQAKKERKKLEKKKVKPVKKVNERKELREKARLAKIETQTKAKLAKEKREEELLKKKLELEGKKKKKKEKDEYRNENLTIEKVPLSKKIENFFKGLNDLPNKISKSVREKWRTTSFAKNKHNMLDLNRQALLLEFNGKDAERSEVKIMYEYIVKDKNGKIHKGYADGYSKVEVHSYLLSEGYQVYSIRTNKWIQSLHSAKSTNQIKIKTKDLIFFVTQLSTYLKSGITLIESLKILCRQYKKKTYIKIFKMIIYDLSMGESFSTALENRGAAFPNLLITMVKSAEMTGELPEVLDDMADYFTESEKTRKQMITAMMYPTIVFLFALCVLTFIMVYVIPKFVDIYASMDGVNIPGITQMIINISDFVKKNLFLLIAGLVGLVVLFNLLYDQVKMFRKTIQWILMHLPVVSSIIIYKEVTMFTKTFASLLAHNVYITDSMEILSKVTQNEIYKELIINTVTNLGSGERLSAEFEGHWAFPIPAYEMIVTGERTGQLPEMMSKVSAYYQELHQNSVTRIKTFIEPILIVGLTAMVGVIVLSIVLPMFNMYQSIQTTV